MADKLATLRDEVERRGGRLVAEHAGRWMCYQIESPDGQLWDGELSSMVCEWRAGDPAYRDAALTDAIDRVREATLEPGELD